jgi:hypothetical protein
MGVVGISPLRFALRSWAGFGCRSMFRATKMWLELRELSVLQNCEAKANDWAEQEAGSPNRKNYY